MSDGTVSASVVRPAAVETSRPPTVVRFEGLESKKDDFTVKLEIGKTVYISQAESDKIRAAISKLPPEAPITIWVRKPGEKHPPEFKTTVGELLKQLPK